MNRYLIYATNRQEDVNKPSYWYPGPFGTVREALTHDTHGCVAHARRLGRQPRCEVLAWLEEQGVDHFFTLEDHKMSSTCAVTKRAFSFPVDLVILEIPSDDAAFYLRMKFGPKPLGPDDDLRADPPPLWLLRP